MKKLFPLILCALLLIACNKDEETTLSVDKDTLAFANDGSITDNTLAINSNTDWEITGGQTWFTLSHTSGSGNATVTVTATGENLGSKLTAKLSIASPQGLFTAKEVTVTQAGSSVDIFDEISDADFKAYCKAFDTDSDGQLTPAEANTVLKINVAGKNIKSLSGIENFTKLDTLVCPGNQLTALNIAGNTNLRYLNCFGNPLYSLDISKNTNLTYLDCSLNSLATLDVSHNTALEDLLCNINLLTSLNISGNTALKTLNCSSNFLATLDVSNNTALTNINCSGTSLTSLDLSNNTALEILYCSNNSLTTLDVSNNTALEILLCYKNLLATLDLSNNTALEILNCTDNPALNTIYVWDAFDTGNPAASITEIHYDSYNNFVHK